MAADFSYGVMMYNVSDVHQPYLAGVAPIPDAQGLAVCPNEETAFINSETTGLWIVNITDPLHPSILMNMETLKAISVTLYNCELAFLASNAEGIMVLNITILTKPKLVS